MAELVVIWLCLAALAVLVFYGVWQHMQASEWESIAEHHEVMAALDPERGRG